MNNLLEVGSVVELRNKKRGMVMPSNRKLVVVFPPDEEYSLSMYLDIADLNDDLTHSRRSDFDIVKVYGQTDLPANAMSISDAGRKLIWSRPEVQSE